MSLPHASKLSEVRLEMRSYILVGMLALAARMWFWWSTLWTIEDGLIYARIVRTFSEHGVLSFNDNARVSTATSPIFALLAGVLSKLGADPIASLKLIGLLAGVSVCILVYRHLMRRYSPGQSLLGVLPIVFLPPVVAYSVSGLETSLYILFCFVALDRSVAGKFVWAFLAGACAAIIRPDGILLFPVLLAARWVFGRTSLAGIARELVPGAILLVLCYCGHAWYYHSFLPQSFLAKAAGYVVNPLQNTLEYLERMVWTQKGSLLIYVVAGVGIWRSVRAERRMVVMIAWYLVYHMSFMVRAPFFDWYLQPPLVVLCLFAGIGLIETVKWMQKIRLFSLPDSQKVGLASVVVGVISIVMLMHYAEGKKQSYENEMSVRGKAGEWLSVHAQPADTAFTESLGYIGYYSRNRFIDWPGLTTPGVSDLLKTRGRHIEQREGYNDIIRKFKPQWLVLRQEEEKWLDPDLRASYGIVAIFPSQAPQPPGYIVAKRSTD